MKIENNKAVSIHYTLTNDAGETVDSSKGGEPLNYLQGHQNIIPGLESALEGKEKGAKMIVDVESKDAYGERHEQLIQVVPKTEFPDVDQVQVGMQFQVDTPNGPMIVTVAEISDDSVTVDGNHPMAGMNLHFDVEVMEVRDGTEKEIEHGHIHAPESDCEGGACCD